jgi:hypothetical protein
MPTSFTNVLPMARVREKKVLLQRLGKNILLGVNVIVRNKPENFLIWYPRQQRIFSGAG